MPGRFFHSVFGFSLIELVARRLQIKN